MGRRLAVSGVRARGDGAALITRGAITRIADHDGVSAPVVEGEKLRCVIQRLLCGDISDLHRLLVREGVDIEESWARFEEKARFKNLDPALLAERLDAREPQYRRRWEHKLSDLERPATVRRSHPTVASPAAGSSLTSIAVALGNRTCSSLQELLDCGHEDVSGVAQATIKFGRHAACL
jgi:hypothetical protein